MSTRIVLIGENHGSCYPSVVDYRELAKRLIPMRKSVKGLTQQVMADRLGVTQSLVSGWEKWVNIKDPTDEKEIERKQVRRPSLPDLARYVDECGRELDLRFPFKDARGDAHEIERIAGLLEAEDRQLLQRIARAMTETKEFRETLRSLAGDMDRLIKAASARREA